MMGVFCADLNGIPQLTDIIIEPEACISYTLSSRTSYHGWMLIRHLQVYIRFFILCRDGYSVNRGKP